MPRIYVLSKNKKNIKIFLMKFSVFTAKKITVYCMVKFISFQYRIVLGVVILAEVVGIVIIFLLVYVPDTTSFLYPDQFSKEAIEQYRDRESRKEFIDRIQMDVSIYTNYENFSRTRASQCPILQPVFRTCRSGSLSILTYRLTVFRGLSYLVIWLSLRLRQFTALLRNILTHQTSISLCVPV